MTREMRVTNTMSCSPDFEASLLWFLPIYCPATTAPPVAKAPNIFMSKNVYLRAFRIENSDISRRTVDVKELLEAKTEQEKKEGFRETAETMADFKKITDELLQYDNIFLEICGLWLWISGDTKPIKDKLKALGCFYASKKSYTI